MAEIGEGLRERAKSLRSRTIFVSLSLTVLIVFYCLLQWVITGEINVISLIIVGAIQLISHFTYYDDGILFGQRDKKYEEAAEAYNNKADEINENHKFSALEKYCDYEFEERKQRYIRTQLGYIGIEEDAFLELKQKSQKDIKTLKSYTHDGRIMFFTRKRKKLLYNLIFKPIPVEKNEPETIMSAVSLDKTRALKNDFESYTHKIHTMRVLGSTVVSTFFALIGIYLKSFSLESIFEMAIYMSSMIITSVFSYSAGEKGVKIYKKKFYIELAQFIDNFNEWERVQN